MTNKDDAFRELMSLMVTETPEARKTIHDALKLTAITEDPAIFDVFLYGLDNIDWRVREGAVRSLMWCVQRDIIPQLIHATGDDHPAVRKAAIEALGRSNDPRAEVPLIRSLTDRGKANPNDEEVWEYAAAALDRFDTRLSQAAVNVKRHSTIANAMSDRDPYYRRSAAIMIGSAPNAVKLVDHALTSCKDDDLWVRAYCIEALATIGVQLKHLTNSPYRPEDHRKSLSSVMWTLRRLRLDLARPAPAYPRISEMARAAEKRIHDAKVEPVEQP